MMDVSGIVGTARELGIGGNGIFGRVMNAAENIARRILRGRGSVIKIARRRPSAEDGGNPLVYDLTVEKHHCYRANGILVSNSDAFRYLAMGLRAEVAKPAPIKYPHGVRGIV